MHGIAWMFYKTGTKDGDERRWFVNRFEVIIAVRLSSIFLQSNSSGGNSGLWCGKGIR